MSGIEIQADRIIVKLIDQLLGMSKRIDNLVEEQNQHFEMIAELQPKLDSEGNLLFTAMTAGEESKEIKVIAHRDSVLAAATPPNITGV